MTLSLGRSAAALGLAAALAACATPEQKLSDAIRHKKTKRAKALISRGADVNARDKDGALPLLSAEASGQTELVRLLVSRGASVNVADEKGGTALEWAVRRGDVETAGLMIDKGAAVNAQDSSGGTALIAALTAKKFNAARLLVEKGADVLELGRYGLPLLVYAMAPSPSPEQRAVVDLLIAKGADADDPRLNADPYIAGAAYKARLPRILAVVELGDAAAKAGRAAEALKLYAEALKQTPAGEEQEPRLMAKFVEAARAAAADAPVSQEAKDHAARARAEIQSASGAGDYASALSELEQAAALAPAWPAAYDDMGLVEEKLGDFNGAIRSLNYYLAFAPDAPDAAAVRARIVKLGAARDKAAGR